MKKQKIDYINRTNADKISDLLYWFTDQGIELIDPYYYPYDFPVDQVSFRRMLHSLFFKNTYGRSVRQDPDGDNYFIYRHRILPINGGDSAVDTWMALKEVFEDKDLLRRAFRVNTQEYNGKIGECGKSISEVRDEVNSLARILLNKNAEHLTSKGIAGEFRAVIEFYIERAYTHKTHHIHHKKTNICNFFFRKRETVT